MTQLIVDRRTLCVGMMLSALPATVSAQTSPADDEPRLLSNLFTRMSARTGMNGTVHTFVLDTGAGRTAVAQDVADALGLPAGPPILVHGITSAELAPTVLIRRLTFGGRRFSQVQAAVFPRELLAADGLLGLDVLSRFKLEFDLVARTMRLRPSGPDVVEIGSASATPTRLRRGDGAVARVSRFGQLILPNIRAAGVEADSFIDSGAQYSIGNMALFRATQASRGLTGPAMTEVYGVTGQTLSAFQGEVGALEIGHYRIGRVPLLFADLHAFDALGLSDRPALLVGADLLYRFRRVSLDFAEGRYAFSGLRAVSRS